MDDDDSPVKPDIAHDGELLLYDYLKWITTLTLLTLGGVLSLSQASDIALDDFDVAIVLIPLCIAGVSALSGADAIVRRRFDGAKRRIRPLHYMRLSVIGLGIGTGAFLSVFWEALT